MAKRPHPRPLRGGVVRPLKALDRELVKGYAFCMGTPLHKRDPENVGETCVWCEENVWGVGFTPYIVRIVFHSVVAEVGSPDPPNNIPISCEQVAGGPCTYQGWITYGGSNFQVRWYSTTALVTMEWINGFARGMFWGYANPCTAGPYPNDFTPGLGWAYGGNAYVLDLPLKYIATLADDYAFGTDSRLLYDDNEGSDPAQRIVRFTGRDSPGCVWIRFEPP